ncbi:uncharacterized protein LOC119681426 [Teleopsis dalmanni]|uniref:uncharacterized protein LOC119681426 n=2 Tax=Teleopsis dalmanni TaxID=139649 RepID=UPI0018CD6B4E|nr:uncharacterized protein LOC119681426 [Teleopsis dalmanni]
MGDISETLNKKNNTKCENSQKLTENKDEELTPNILKTYANLTQQSFLNASDLKVQPISGAGDNSYGLVLQVNCNAKSGESSETPFSSILKISPKNPARRAHMNVFDFYTREVFLYEKVFEEFHVLAEERNSINGESAESALFDIVPKMFSYSLENHDEFIIFEDLLKIGYIQNARSKPPTYDLVLKTFQTLAKFHAMSFILQAKKPKVFTELVSQMVDNLFTENIADVSVEFGKTYIKRTRDMLVEETEPKTYDNTADMIAVLDKVEQNFKKVGISCVQGNACAPYAVICHGDFWNNNILYKLDSNQCAESAKFVDFQIARYAAPVLDLIHYTFTCTEKTFRDAHLNELLDIYYKCLAKHICLFALDPTKIYPEQIFKQQLCRYGIFGLCMAAFSIPFFISNSNELVDLDEVCEAISVISAPEDSTTQNANNSVPSSSKDSANKSEENNEKNRALINDYYLLTPRSEPIFKRRMTGVVCDILKYDMADYVLNL